MGLFGNLFASCDDLFGKGFDLENVGRYSEALEYYDKIISKCPNFKGIYYRKSLMLFALKKFQEELDCYYTGLAMESKTSMEITLKWMRGQALLDLGKYQEAINDFDFFIHNGGNIVTADDNENYLWSFSDYSQLEYTHRVWFKKGIAYYKLNKPIDALNCFNKSIFFAPGIGRGSDRCKGMIYYARASRWRGQILKEYTKSDFHSLPFDTLWKSMRGLEDGPLRTSINSIFSQLGITDDTSPRFLKNMLVAEKMNKEILEKIAASSLEEAEYEINLMKKEMPQANEVLREFSPDLDREFFR